MMRWTPFDKYILLLLMVIGVSSNAYSADDDYLEELERYFANASKQYCYIDEQGDTMIVVALQPIICFSKTKFKNAKAEKKYYQQYYRMIYNLKKVYPYAQTIKQKMAEMDAEFVKLKTDRARKAYIKRVEKELFAEFEPHVRKMTISQGKMLIKLINRETGKTGYSIIKELKGSLSALFWQTIATLFSSSLKTEFEPDKDDKLLNELIILYESGML
ncbi:hypothetical protein FACS189456_2730 [Bacteroidia bacterium]|nr:hypothetical protein FACS189452_10640 [Bacteroidia bacterium]GHT72951.1 hypothetical protein FACS189456_2730 [Bacteroidia bacterium]GHT80850.1 hypothetical protein FACS189467_3890 [Bacteroidia bacterium]